MSDDSLYRTLRNAKTASRRPGAGSGRLTIAERLVQVLGGIGMMFPRGLGLAVAFCMLVGSAFLITSGLAVPGAILCVIGIMTAMSAAVSGRPRRRAR